MLDIALHYGVQFFEIGIVAPTVAQFAAILQCADQAMHSGGGHCGH
jgi:hypothetical protein